MWDQVLARFTVLCVSLRADDNCDLGELVRRYGSLSILNGLLHHLSVSLSISPLFLRHYVGIACVQSCSSALSYTCFHISSPYQHTCHAYRSDCWSSMIAYSFSVNSSTCFCFTIVFHLFYILLWFLSQGWSALLSFHLYSHNIHVCWLSVTICCRVSDS